MTLGMLRCHNSSMYSSSRAVCYSSVPCGDFRWMTVGEASSPLVSEYLFSRDGERTCRGSQVGQGKGMSIMPAENCSIKGQPCDMFQWRGGIGVGCPERRTRKSCRYLLEYFEVLFFIGQADMPEMSSVRSGARFVGLPHTACVCRVCLRLVVTLVMMIAPDTGSHSVLLKSSIIMGWRVCVCVTSFFVPRSARPRPFNTA